MAEISRTCASIRFFGDDLDPEELTRLLMCQPDKAARKGQPLRHRFPSRHGKWIVDSAREDGDQLDRQIFSLFASMSQDLSVWTALTRRFKADVFCGAWMVERDEGMELSPDIMRMMAERGLKFGLCLYFEGDDRDHPVTK